MKLFWYSLENSIELNATDFIVKFIYVVREENNSFPILKCNGGLEMQSKLVSCTLDKIHMQNQESWAVIFSWHETSKIHIFECNLST